MTPLPKYYEDVSGMPSHQVANTLAALSLLKPRTELTALEEYLERADLTSEMRIHLRRRYLELTEVNYAG